MSTTSLMSEVSANPPRTAEAPGSYWWFDGRSASHYDWFIDLQGTRTDHLPDVRSYLIAVGSTQQPPTDDLKPEEKDQWRLEQGKRFLLEEWEKGNGYFIGPDVLGRDYTVTRQTERMPDFGVAWYRDLRATLEMAKDEHAQVARYADKGFRYDPFPGCGRDDDPDVIYSGPYEEDQQPLIRASAVALFQARKPQLTPQTNLRVPLPWQEYTRPRPGDARWDAFIKCLYSFNVHPAPDALNTGDYMDALDCDTQRHFALDRAGFLDFAWTLRWNEFPELD